jgi:predicted small lipoprotein YifL
MMSGKNKTIYYGINDFLCFILLASSFILLFSLAACGRRADPVLLPSHDEETVSEDSPEQKEEEAEEETLIEEDIKEKERTEVSRPDAPAGLKALYTGRTIILAWEDVVKQGVTLYRIYRSSGNEYILAGETVTSAFTDRDIKKDIKYYYQVTAVGTSESLRSEEIMVSTETE